MLVFIKYGNLGHHMQECRPQFLVVYGRYSAVIAWHIEKKIFYHILTRGDAQANREGNLISVEVPVVKM